MCDKGNRYCHLLQEGWKRGAASTIVPIPAHLVSLHDRFISAVEALAGGRVAQADRMLTQMHSENRARTWWVHFEAAQRQRWDYFAKEQGFPETPEIPPASRAKPTGPALKRELFHRDGYTCAFCGLKTVAPEVRAELQRVLGRQGMQFRQNVPKTEGNTWDEHVGLLWIASDEHIHPRSRGGTTTLDNLVTACVLCNCAKDKYESAALGLRTPEPARPTIAWDGLLSQLHRLKPLEVRS